MNEIRTGRSLARPRRIVRSSSVLSSFAALHRGLPCGWCVVEGRERVHPFEEVHHILGGARREDADWNLAAICRGHHQHPVHGFHGARPLWDATRAFELKRTQGYTLPRDAWAYLPEGFDAGPAAHPVQALNRIVTARVCDELRAWSF